MLKISEGVQTCTDVYRCEDGLDTHPVLPGTRAFVSGLKCRTRNGLFCLCSFFCAIDKAIGPPSREIDAMASWDCVVSVFLFGFSTVRC